MLKVMPLQQFKPLGYVGDANRRPLTNSQSCRASPVRPLAGSVHCDRMRGESANDDSNRSKRAVSETGAFIHNDDMVETSTSYGADQPFQIQSLPLRLRCSRDFLNPHKVHPDRESWCRERKALK